MSLRVKKELERIYDGLLSVTAVCLCRVKRTGMSMASKSAACADGNRAIKGVQAMAGVLHAERRTARNAGGNGKRAINGKWAINVKNVNARNSNDSPSQAAFTIFRKFFVFIPLPSHIAQPIHSLSTNRTELDPATFHNESILDANAQVEAQMGASMPFSARRRRLVWLRKTGLDAPCATVNLARDALDESLILTNAVAV